MMYIRKCLMVSVCLLVVTQSLFASAKPTNNSENRPEVDLSKERVLYAIGYSHLDTQWRWDYQTTIDHFIRDTLDQNIYLLEKYPDYVFNFTGSTRYEMMKEYYPDKYKKVKQYVKDGRWFVSGSSVDEGDVLVPSPESIVRQVLYGNEFFRDEFGTESYDYMLPDCFGFPASLPSIWAHCGLKGFSTQKLTWGSIVGIPFNIGRWEGPDGKFVVAALNPSSYAGAIKGRVDTNEYWSNRVKENGDKYGIYADYHYYGVGDRGGAPHEKDVKNYIESMGNADSEFRLVLAPSDQLYLDLTKEQKKRLPSYKGDMLLTEHSAGSLSSQAYMKRCNRKNEQLADAAERAAVTAKFLGACEYPQEKLVSSWYRVLGSQFHDILPGTCLPKAYEYAWNDEILALNGFSSVLLNSSAAISQALDTTGKGVALVVYNPLAIEREDIVEAEVHFVGKVPEAVKVYDPAGNEVPSQIIGKTADSVKVVFAAKLAPVSYEVYDVRPTDSGCSMKTGLKVKNNVIENEYYVVRINEAGDVESIFDKKAKRELLEKPHRLAFLYEKPRSYPAWNMDWTDRKNPPVGYVDGPATLRIVEDGPARVVLQVTRKCRDSIFTQQIRLASGDAGRRVEFKTFIDWQGRKCSLKASFPLTVSNKNATYNWGLGTVERGNNSPKMYEVPSHEWFDLTESNGDYGVSILEDCKFGSDKPEDNTVRLTLLYTPAVSGITMFCEEYSQDWGRHDMIYAVYGHKGDWRDGRSEWQGRRLNQPLVAFQAPKHTGRLGRTFSMFSVNTEQIDIRAIKKAEKSDYTIVRFQELFGQDAKNVTLTSATAIVEAYEVDGQERRIGPAVIRDGKLIMQMTSFSLRSFAVKLADAPVKLTRPVCKTVDLEYNCDVLSFDGEKKTSGMGLKGKTIPAELIPERLVREDIAFVIGPKKSGSNNAVACKGQVISLPQGDYNRVYILAAASEDTVGTFKIGNAAYELSVQSWTGYIGQYDNRVWDREFEAIDYYCHGWVVGIEKAYTKRDNVAWFCTHRHDAEGRNEAYQFSYIYKYALETNGGGELVLPDNDKIKVFAVTVAKNNNDSLKPAMPLYDDFAEWGNVELRVTRDPKPYVTKGMKPLGKVTAEKKSQYEDLNEGPPKVDDCASSHNGVKVEFIGPNTLAKSDVKTGAGGAVLSKLIDGKKAENNDDTANNVWFDNCEARLVMDLGKSVSIDKINTYSWHGSNRSPQMFILWGSNDKVCPNVRFEDGKSDWEFIAQVDTCKLGRGGIHCSTVGFGDEKPNFRYILWVIEDNGEGTFFTEFDVIEAKKNND